LKVLADQGNAAAQFQYGSLLTRGEGISMNKSLAVHYHRLSADQGDAQTQFNYGLMRTRGEGI
jgi:TPR repeat protein